MRYMKLKKDFIVHNSEGESLLVPTGNAGFSGIVKGNKTFGAILELLKNDTTEEEITAAMRARFDAPEEAVSRDVKKAIEKLREIGAIDG